MYLVYKFKNPIFQSYTCLAMCLYFVYYTILRPNTLVTPVL